MERYPADMANFMDMFATEEACWWLGTHQGAIRPIHLPYYLDELTFRFNQRTSRSRGKLFYRLVAQSLQIDPVPPKTFKHNI